MTKAIRILRTGGPEVLEYVDVDVGAPGLGQVRVRHHAIGVNFIDVYFRSGLYPLPLPFTPGMEGAGLVEAVGEGVSHLQPGDRVAYASRPPGSYAEARVMPAGHVIRLPDSISFETGAAMMLQGLTVQCLFNRVRQLKAGDTILFHAAAGGVGLIACQWARALGVTMIGTVGSDEKGELAKSHGCAHVINYNTEDFAERVKEITNGAKVPVVYDSIGKDTFMRSLDCVAPLGLMVSFGNASGPVAPFALTELASRGSLTVTRPTVFDYMAKRSDFEEMAADLFGMVESGKVKVEIKQVHRLEDAARAHTELEGRRTTGSTILIP